MQNLLSSEMTLDQWATVQFDVVSGSGVSWLEECSLDSSCLGFICALWPLMLWLQPQSTHYAAPPNSWMDFAQQFSQGCSYPCWWCIFSYNTFFLPLSFQWKTIFFSDDLLWLTLLVELLSSGHLSGQQSSPWLCDQLNHIEKPIKGSGNICRCFDLISW